MVVLLFEKWYTRSGCHGYSECLLQQGSGQG
jgi:hypothetical protein